MEEIVENPDKKLKTIKIIAWCFLIFEFIWMILLIANSFSPLKGTNSSTNILLWIHFIFFFWLTLTVVRTKHSPTVNAKIVMIKLILVGVLFVLPTLAFISLVTYLISNGSFC